ncbi:hypothetical protein D915_009483 [Fasciola hepatica]|uniref:Uncharacterized protein n=1 Tax=Fasciola hepatica TaxID=6192 RepID=A0A4E0R2W4_FASHE|nr:hypothetical protein D915_009483 [Fasciola hepatica]
MTSTDHVTAKSSDSTENVVESATTTDNNHKKDDGDDDEDYDDYDEYKDENEKADKDKGVHSNTSTEHSSTKPIMVDENLDEWESARGRSSIVTSIVPMESDRTEEIPIKSMRKTPHLSNAPSSENRNTEVQKPVSSVLPVSPSLINGISSISSGGFVPEDVTSCTQWYKTEPGTNELSETDRGEYE